MSNVRELPREVALQGAEPRVARYRRLSPGPGAPHDQVLANQRSRICGAVIEIVAGDGYGALTVREIVRLAGVSTHTFYELFDDKDECFRETYASVVRRSAQHVIAAQEACEQKWEQRLKRAFVAFAHELCGKPKAAQLALVESFSGGEMAHERMRSAMGLYEGMLSHSFATAPDAKEKLPLVVKGIVAGVAQVCRGRLMSGGADDLAGIAEELADWALSLRCPEAAVVERLRAPAERPAKDAQPLCVRRSVGKLDDRQRILDAIVALVAREGYRGLTVPRVRMAAGVSRSTFDAQFKGVQECFSAAVRQLTERALRRAAQVGGAAPNWPQGIVRTMRELCLLIATDPVYGKLAFREAFVPGPKAVRSCDATAVAVARSLIASAPEAQRPDELRAEASIGAGWGLMHQFVIRGHQRELPRRAPLLAYLLLAPAIGGEAALQALAAEQGRLGGSKA